MKTLSAKITLVIILVGTLMLCNKSDGFISGLILAPFVFGPVLPHFWLSRIWTSRYSDRVLSAASVLFGVWFVYIYCDVFFWHPDAQSPIALLFIGAWAVPALAVAWLLAYLLRNRGRTA